MFNHKMNVQRSGWKRVLAGVCAAVLAMTTVPSNYFAPVDVMAEDRTVIEFNASTMADGYIKTETTVGDFTLHASSEFSFNVDTNDKKSEDGTLTFTKRLKSGGATTENNRSITFYAPGPGTVTVYMLSANSGDSSRKLGLYNSETDALVNNQEFKAPAAAAEGGILSPFEFTVSEAGTYRFKVNAAINIYYIKGDFEGVGEAPSPRADWSDVADPVINSVTVNEAGDVDVDVDCVLGHDGADAVRLFFMQNGFEVNCVTVDEPGVVTVSPSREGDYEIYAVASRTACADKTSNKESLSGYVLPLTAPEITWINNLGGGSVYVDWLNLDADRYELYYSVNGGAETQITEVPSDAESYTITGLEEGAEVTVRVKAFEGTLTSEDTATITVGEPVQQWYISAIGSGTSNQIMVNNEIYDVTSSTEITPVADATNSEDGVVDIFSTTNGKIADSEDGFFYYFTKIDPNTENFKLSATFTVTDVSDGPDNQTGYGIYATDILGIGSKDTKYFNSIAVGQFKLKSGYHANGARFTTGYTSYDPTNLIGDTRTVNNSNAFSVANTDDSVNVGDSFTFALEKTNTGYVLSMDGASETIPFDGADALMKQEDGSLCVGVMAARKVGISVSNMKFEKTAGSVEGESKILVDPALDIYSSNTSGTADIDVIFAANADGTVDVKDASGASIPGCPINVEGNKVIKLPYTLTSGTNNFSATYTPAESDSISSNAPITKDFSIEFQQLGAEGTTMYVSSWGTPSAKGTAEDPLDLQTCLNYAQPGQVIVLQDGIYSPTESYQIGRNVNGRSDAMITLMAEHPGEVEIVGDNLGDAAEILGIGGSYWHVYGIDFAGSPGKGVSVAGNYNIVELCSVRNNKNTGLQISRMHGEPNDNEMWPSYNLIKNCDAYDNCDDAHNDADGFAAKLTSGVGNTFYGCISHHNADDGWDLYAKSTTGKIGAVTIENCVAYSNGFLTTDNPDSEETKFGDGNGFKLGGENIYGGHTVINCIAYNNYSKGFTSNSCPDISVTDCTSYNNSLNGKAYNVSLYTRTSNTKEWVLSGMLSVATNGKTIGELGSSNGVLYSLKDKSNYLFDGSSSYNSEGEMAEESWFANVDITVLPTRNEDGTIDMHGLLTPNANCPRRTGARIYGAETEGAASVQPSITTQAEITPLSGVAESTTSNAENNTTGSNLPLLLGGIGAVLIAILCVVLLLRKKN